MFSLKLRSELQNLVKKFQFAMKLLADLLPNLPQIDKTLTIAVKKYAKADIKAFLSGQILFNSIQENVD